MTRDPIIGEFVGTFIMILLGNGVVAGCVLKRTKAEGAGWMAITTGWAFAVLCGIFTANLFGSPDAHLNPAITLAFAVKTGAFTKMLPYLVAQIGGAFAGAAVVWLFYLPHWKVTENQEVKLGVFLYGARDSFLCSEPAKRSYRDLRSRYGCRCDELKTRALHWSSGRVQSVPGRLSRLVARVISGRNHRLRD